jgi:hypothetical protein
MQNNPLGEVVTHFLSNGFKMARDYLYFIERLSHHGYEKMNLTRLDDNTLAVINL